ncbi:MAG TPA: hypothetical protein VJZ32_11425 [Candidatus Bathyarchaeia archaeon]|nr:hypothetical protein [Candidatus Bathyarchaeia archaeon]
MKNKPRDKHKPSRIRSYSFIITIMIVAMLSLAFYVSSQPTVSHVPTTFEFNPQPWMAFVPNQVQYVGYVNYHQAYVISGNPSLFGSRVMLLVPQLKLTIFPSDVMYELDIQLIPPQFNGTVSILSLTQERLDTISNALQNLNTTTIRSPISYDGDSIYTLLIQKFGESKMTLAYLAMVQGKVILSYDQATGLQNVETILDQVSSNVSNLFDNATLRDAIFVTAPLLNCIAFFVGMFPTQFAASNLIAKSVTYTASSLIVTRAFLFPSPDLATNNLAEAEQIYNGASCTTADSWLMITQTYSIGRLTTELSGI